MTCKHFEMMLLVTVLQTHPGIPRMPKAVEGLRGMEGSTL